MVVRRTISPWSCLLASFAMVLDETCEQLIKEIGHDGSEVVFPEEEDPFARRAFHIQELIDCCERRHLAVTPIDFHPISTCGRQGRYEVDINEGPSVRFQRHLHKRVGVITGLNLNSAPHAVAWNGLMILDPATGNFLEPHLFQCETFWKVTNQL